jgi:hypothetical protein
MAMTLRLQPGLKTEADALASQLGISLNALVAVALRGYLDSQRPRRTPSSAPSPSVPRAAAPRRENPVNSPHLYTVASRSDPCPCGATDPNGHLLKFKHCHGKPAS